MKKVYIYIPAFLVPNNWDDVIVVKLETRFHIYHNLTYKTRGVFKSMNIKQKEESFEEYIFFLIFESNFELRWIISSCKFKRDAYVTSSFFSGRT